MFAAAAVSAATLCVLAAPAGAGDYRFAYMDGRVKLDDGYVFDLGGGVGETSLGFADLRHPVRQYNSSIYTVRHGAKVTRTAGRWRGSAPPGGSACTSCSGAPGMWSDTGAPAS